MGRLEGKRALAWCGAGLLGGVEGALDHPVVLGNKRQALTLARHDEGERRRLHAARRAHVAVARELHEGEVAREHRAPDKVDILARCAGGRQIDVKLHEVGERVGNFLFREGGVAGARDGGGRVHFLDARERIGADELALAVEVRRDHDGVRLLREVLQAADDFLFLRKFLNRRVDQVRQRVHLPPFELHAVFGEGLFLLEGGLGQTCGHIGGHGLALDGHALPAAALLIYQVGSEVGLQDMAAQTDGHPLLAVNLEPVDRRRIYLVGFRLARAQKARNLGCRVVFLRYDQFHMALLAPERLPRTGNRSHDCPDSSVFTCAGILLPYRAQRPNVAHNAP